MIIKKNQVGLSALDYATMANNPKIAAFLANILYIFGQDVLGKDSEGNTILHMMARKVRMYSWAKFKIVLVKKTGKKIILQGVS